MRIIDYPNRKDYWDYLAWQYGVDDTVVFDRHHPVGAPNGYYAEVLLGNIPFRDYLLPNGDRDCVDILHYFDMMRRPNHQARFKNIKQVHTDMFTDMTCSKHSKNMSANIYLLVYLGIPFICVEGHTRITNGSAAEESKITQLWENQIYVEYESRYNKYAKEIYSTKNITETYEEYLNMIKIKRPLLILNKSLKVPYFTMEIPDRFNPCTSIHSKIPHLKDIKGFTNMFPAERIYQDVYNFFIEIKDPVDVTTPVELSDKNKIHKAGFDIKQSFRKRKN